MATGSTVSAGRDEKLQIMKSKIRIIQAKVENYLKNYRHIVKNGYMPRHHAIFADPPYYLDTIVKRFGKPDAAPAQYGRDGAFARASKGFMGQEWDGFESPWHYQTWVTLWAEMMLDYVYPGAILLMTGGSRTYHRLVCGLEDAGWEIYDCIWNWTYGSGMPKSYNLHGVDDPAWDGYGTALKPSVEPIVLARAPRQGHTYDHCALEFGTGSLNIEGSRLESGRYPVNTILQHHPDCDDASCVRGCHVLTMAEQSGQKAGGSAVRGDEPSNLHSDKIYFRRDRIPHPGYDDTGTAARFFYQAKAASWERDAGLEVDCRNPHPTVKPIQLTTLLAGLIKPPVDDARILVPFSGSGSEMIGAWLAGWRHITGIEMTPEYIPVAKARLQWWQRFDSYDHAKLHHDSYQKQVKEADVDEEIWEQKTLWEILA